MPEHIRKVFHDVETSSEQLQITLNELTPLVRIAMTLIVIFAISLAKVMTDKIVLRYNPRF